MEDYIWPGNIRELRNVIERICIMRTGPTLLPEYLPQEIRTLITSTAPLPAALNTLPQNMGLEDAIAGYECSIIRQALEKSHSNVMQTATRLKIPRGTLRYKMDKYGLS